LGTIVSQKGAQVPRTRPPYPPEFKAEAVKLARSSEKPLSELARDLGVSTETLRSSLKQQQIDAGKRNGVTTDEREELRRLRKENKILKEEREVLGKATAFFAAEEKGSRRRR
jgi:transposase